MNLLVDMGNTRLKWATLENGQLFTGESVLNAELNQALLVKHWQPLAPPQQLLIACVTANQTLELVTAVATRLWSGINIKRVQSQAQGFGITNAYIQPEKLGVDRWLALIAARHHYTLPACIVDCGTAMTVDLLAADGRHVGGLISAGLTLMKTSLASGTNALPFSNTAYPLALANFTEAGIYSGTLFAVVGLIEQVLSKYNNPLLILAGGDAELIAPHLSITPVMAIDLVLRGLAIVAQDDATTASPLKDWQSLNKG
jgi:type III pantothenate kinase